MKQRNWFKLGKKSGNFRTVFCSLAVALVLFLSNQAMAADNGQRLSLKNGSDAFEFSIVPEKKTYEVDDPIRFVVKGNKDFFLYLFTINRQDQTAVLLIPGSKQKGNKYKRGNSFVVPNNSLEFYSDRPGKEEIVAIASTKYLDLKTAEYREMGSFMTTSASEVDNQLKALSIRSEKKAEDEHVVEKLEISIAHKNAGPTPVADTPDKPIVFAAIDKPEYQLGNVVKLAFGADKSGFVSIYTIEPGNKVSLLKSEPVDGRQIYSLKAQAAEPSGPHALVAVFSDQKPAESHTESVSKLFDSEQSKSLILVEGDTPPYAIVKFNVNP